VQANLLIAHAHRAALTLEMGYVGIMGIIRAYQPQPHQPQLLQPQLLPPPHPPPPPPQPQQPQPHQPQQQLQ